MRSVASRRTGELSAGCPPRSTAAGLAGPGHGPPGGPGGRTLSRGRRLVSPARPRSSPGARHAPPPPPAAHLGNAAQVVAGVGDAEAQDQRQAHARAEEADADLVLQVERQLPGQHPQVHGQALHSASAAQLQRRPACPSARTRGAGERRRRGGARPQPTAAREAWPAPPRPAREPSRRALDRPAAVDPRCPWSAGSERVSPAEGNGPGRHLPP